MSENLAVEFRRARAEDFSDILRIQAANLIGNLKPQDCQDGFLSAEFSRRQLEEIESDIVLLVASEKSRLLGYLNSIALAPGLRSRSDCFGGVGKEDTLRYAAHRLWPTGRRVASGEAL